MSKSSDLNIKWLMLVLNELWLLLCILYINTDLSLTCLHVYGLIAAAVYGLVFFIQAPEMTIHCLQAIFTNFRRMLFGKDTPVWVYECKIS